LGETAKAKLGVKIRSAREEKGLSLQQLGELVGLSGQQLRRIEKGTADVTAVVLARIARATGRDLRFFLDHVRTVEEQAHRLWNDHKLDRRLRGSRDADFKAKREILEAMELWEE
jgi:transcriptional regulator with XRE-family HTH domain